GCRRPDRHRPDPGGRAGVERVFGGGRPLSGAPEWNRADDCVVGPARFLIFMGTATNESALFVAPVPSRAVSSPAWAALCRLYPSMTPREVPRAPRPEGMPRFRAAPACRRETLARGYSPWTTAHPA